MLTFLDIIVNIVRGVGGGGEIDIYDHLLTKIILTLTMNKTSIQAPKFMRKVATSTIWIC